jgi:hypothetical protein
VLLAAAIDLLLLLLLLLLFHCRWAVWSSPQTGTFGSMCMRHLCHSALHQAD